MHHIKKNSGQTIIEAVIALSTIMLTLAAISVAITTSLNNSDFSKKQALAGRYAQEGMEHMRYLRNVNLTAFTGYSEGGGTHCMASDTILDNEPCDAISDPDDVIDSTFFREVSFLPGVSNCGTRPTIAPASPPESGTQVTVEVRWSSGKCSETDRFCHNVRLVSCFSDGLNLDSGSEL